ncbi:MAG: hypothetical protein V1838_03985 [Patescibacteria group bacterium]
MKINKTDKNLPKNFPSVGRITTIIHRIFSGEIGDDELALLTNRRNNHCCYLKNSFEEYLPDYPDCHLYLMVLLLPFLARDHFPLTPPLKSIDSICKRAIFWDEEIDQVRLITPGQLKGLHIDHQKRLYNQINNWQNLHSAICHLEPLMEELRQIAKPGQTYAKPLRVLDYGHAIRFPKILSVNNREIIASNLQVSVEAAIRLTLANQEVTPNILQYMQLFFRGNYPLYITMESKRGKRKRTLYLVTKNKRRT